MGDKTSECRIGTCALCKETRTLRKSHLAPEFLYKRVYNDKHMILERHTIPAADRWISKGINERLLCDECERLFAREYEEPFYNFWYRQEIGKSIAEAALGCAQAVTMLHGIDYTRFKLFHLSILWRCSVAKGLNFYLGRHEEIIRKMLLLKNAGVATTYPLICSALLRNDGAAAEKMVYCPTHFKGLVGGAKVARAVYAGCEWLFMISENVIEVNVPKILFLQEDGTLLIYFRSHNDVFGRQEFQQVRLKNRYRQHPGQKRRRT